MDWLDLLAVQGTLKSLVQHHSSKASILLCSAFFIVQLSHPYMTTGKTIAFIRTDSNVLFLMARLVGSPCSPRDSQESCPTPQFTSINSSVLSIFIVQLSRAYMTTGKTSSFFLTRRTFVGKVKSQKQIIGFYLVDKFTKL